MDPLTVGIVSAFLIIALVLLGFHVAIALSLVSFLGVYLITGKALIAANLLTQNALGAVSDYVYAVIPLFLIMGLFATSAGATRDLFSASELLLRRVRGGLGVATVFANAVFAAITGVSVASAAVFSTVAIPEMQRLKYNRSFALGIVASSSLLGMLIPPSVLMIVYGIIAQASIGHLFAAGIVPGLLVCVALSGQIVIRAYLNPSLVGQEGASLGGAGSHAADSAPYVKERHGLLRVTPIFLLIGLVLGGIYLGFFTPTEAGAVGALGALVLLALRGKFTLSEFQQILSSTGKGTASIFFLLIAAQLYGRMLSLSGLPSAMASGVTGLDIPPIFVLLFFVLVLLILGCILDSVSILLISMPIMVPIITTLGYDPIYFGMISVVTIELGLLTPPFGMVVFAMKAVLPREVTIEEIFRGSMPFFVALLFVLALIITFPQLSLALPELLF